eukprot:4751005-Ditylum_brightwellii.AAC.1
MQHLYPNMCVDESGNDFAPLALYKYVQWVNVQINRLCIIIPTFKVLYNAVEGGSLSLSGIDAVTGMAMVRF